MIPTVKRFLKIRYVLYLAGGTERPVGEPTGLILRPGAWSEVIKLEVGSVRFAGNNEICVAKPAIASVSHCLCLSLQ